MWVTKTKRNTAQYRAEDTIVRKDAEKVFKSAMEFVDILEKLVRDLT